MESPLFGTLPTALLPVESLPPSFRSFNKSWVVWFLDSVASSRHFADSELSFFRLFCVAGKALKKVVDPADHVVVPFL